ncbi:hypothetical protein JCM8097_000334 [Rhodosporidiobolus ruineniae]
MGGEPWGFLAVFYGVPVRLRSLLRAALAWQSIRGPLSFVDILVRRRSKPSPHSSAALSPIARLPVEVVDHIRRFLVDIALQDALSFPLSTARCHYCDRGEGKMYLGEVWPDFELPRPAREKGKKGKKGKTRRPPRRRNSRSSDDEPCAHCTRAKLVEWGVRDDFTEYKSDTVKLVERFLNAMGLDLPAARLHKAHLDGKNQPATYIAFVSFGRSGEDWTGEGDDLSPTVLDPAVPPGADQHLAKTCKLWQLELEDSEAAASPVSVGTTGSEESEVPGGTEETEKEKKKPVEVKPAWRIISVCGRDD